MKICAYLINGDPISELGRYDSSQLDGNDPFTVIASGAAPSGYEDISSIENWYNFGFTAKKDYKYIRKEIGAIEQASGWINLTTTEKSIAAKMFIVDKTKRDDIYTTEQQISLGLLYHQASVECRQLRFAKASMEVYNRLSPSGSAEVINAIQTDNLPMSYINFGIEGTSEDDPEGLFDYITAASGTSYEITGLAAQSYEPIGMTLEELVNKLMSILKDGEH